MLRRRLTMMQQTRHRALADYAHFLQGAAQHMMAVPPPPLAALLVAALCAGLVSVTLWAQAVQLQLPITFYRARQTGVRRQTHALMDCMRSGSQQITFLSLAAVRFLDA